MPVITAPAPLKRIPKGVLNLNVMSELFHTFNENMDVQGNVKLGDTYEPDERGVILTTTYVDGSVLYLRPIIIKQASNIYYPGVCLELAYASKGTISPLGIEFMATAIGAEYFSVDDYDIAIVAFKRRYHSGHPDQFTTLGRRASQILSVKR